MEIGMEVLEEATNIATIGSSISTSGNIARRRETVIHSSTIYSNQDTQTAQVPINTHTHTVTHTQSPKQWTITQP